jgi:hypothetical protein
MTEWFTQTQSVYIGAFGGAGVGVLGGILGPMAGVLAPRGKAKGLVLGLHGTVVVLGVIVLIAGIVAVSTGQPRHVWYPLLLGGGILTCVMGGLFPVVLGRYRAAEQRRMQAAELRNG